MCIIDPFTLCSLNNLKYEVAFCIKSHFYWRPVGFCSSHIVVWPKTTKCMLMASLFFKILYRTYHVHFLRLSSSPGLLANTGLSPTPPPQTSLYISLTPFPSSGIGNFKSLLAYVKKCKPIGWLYIIHLKMIWVNQEELPKQIYMEFHPHQELAKMWDFTLSIFPSPIVVSVSKIEKFSNWFSQW